MSNKQRIRERLESYFSSARTILKMNLATYKSYKDVVDRNDGLMYFYKDKSTTVRKAEKIISEVHTSYRELINYCNISSQPFTEKEEENFKSLMFHPQKENRDLAFGIMNAKLELLLNERYSKSMQKSID